MELHFTKMHGLGNDFMVVNAVTQYVQLCPKTIQSLSNRHTGIGFDQCLVVEPSTIPEVDFFYRIFNANGEEVGQCGNGARCLAPFIREQGLSDKDVLTVATHQATMQIKQESDHDVLVDMGVPKLKPEQIPIAFSHQADYYPLEVDGETLYVHAVSMGNPHIILLRESLNNELVEQLGPKLVNHPSLPEGANVSFVKPIDGESFMLRVYERGVGETKACGSAACAVAVALKLYHQGEDLQKAHLPGGILSIYWQGLSHTLKCQGPAEKSFEGVVSIPVEKTSHRW